MIEILGRSKSVPVPCGLVSTLRSLEMGESVIIPVSRRSSVHPAAKRAGIRVTVRTLENSTVRVWRVPFTSTSSNSELSSAAPKSIFGDDLRPTSQVTSKPIIDSTVSDYSKDSPPGVWPQIVTTVANIPLNLPAGYYFQNDEFSPRLWYEGRPPETTTGPGSAAATEPKKTIFE